MVVLSLFDGMSCGRIALERAGITPTKYFASEIDPYAIKISKHNYPDIIQLGDISNIKYCDGALWVQGEKVYEGVIDLVIGGSPCQSFSMIGSRSDFQGESGLYWEFSRLIKEIKPKYFLLENVKMKKESEQIISKDLGVNPVLINSALVSGQRRNRLYWVNFQIIELNDKGISFSSVLCQNVTWEKEMPWMRSKIGDTFKIDRFMVESQEKSPTLTTSNNHPLLRLKNEDETLFRRLTVTEFEKLQTVPVGYTSCVSPTRAFHAIGNGWTVDVIAHIFECMKEVDAKNPTQRTP